MSSFFWDLFEHGETLNNQGAIRIHKSSKLKTDHKHFLGPSTTMLPPPPAPTARAASSTRTKPPMSQPEARKLERVHESRRAASARYRDKHRPKVLEAGRICAARRRSTLKDDEDAKARARAASARYRSENRDELALKQRKVRKAAFIKKHGVHAYIQRCFDAPIPREPDSPPPEDSVDDGNADDEAEDDPSPPANDERRMQMQGDKTHASWTDNPDKSLPDPGTHGLNARYGLNARRPYALGRFSVRMVRRDAAAALTEVVVTVGMGTVEGGIAGYVEGWGLVVACSLSAVGKITDMSLDIDLITALSTDLKTIALLDIAGARDLGYGLSAGNESCGMLWKANEGSGPLFYLKIRPHSYDSGRHCRFLMPALQSCQRISPLSSLSSRISFFASSFPSRLSIYRPRLPRVLDMPCTPPYYPGPGHEDRGAHDRNSQCVYYPVFAGFVRGVFTNSWIARAQTDHYTDPRAKSFKKWVDVQYWWHQQCVDAHGSGGCPPFEPVTFSLVPDPVAQPGPPPCTHIHNPDVHGGTTSPAIAGPSTTSVPLPTAAPSPFASTSSSTSSSVSSTSSLSSTLSSGSMSSSGSPSTSRFPKKEEPSSPQLPAAAPATPVTPRQIPGHRPIPFVTEVTPNGLCITRTAPVTPHTRVRLTPAGEAYADAVAARDGPSVLRTPTPASCAAAAAAAPPPPTVLVTPRVSVPANGAAAPAPRRRTRVVQYGIRGVVVFYSTFESAQAAAQALGLPDSKIMFSSNSDKLEQWMSGKPFEGEET
ncbi:hypothetical protein B0H10DRAFT_1939158 [Mycena sp. CBHHK59/15]|nr:hypothetical protein B0H10DRAFT_1939158 [Mycena sp. CBHHK59/15]